MSNKLMLNDLDSKAKRRCLKLLAKVRERGWTWISGGDERRDAWRLYKAGLIYVAISKYRPWMPEPITELKLFHNFQDFKTYSQSGWRYPILRAHKNNETI